MDGHTRANFTSGATSALTGPVNHTFTGTAATLTHSVTQPNNHTVTVTQPSDHTFTQPTFAGTAATLSHSSADHTPPFYALCFIMKA